MSRGVLLIGILVALLVTAAWFFLIISPTNQQIGDAQDQLDQARSDQLTLETQLKTLQRIQENQLLYVEALGAVEQAIPPTPAQAALYDDLAVLEIETGVDLLSIGQAIPQEVEGEDYLATPITIVIAGQYFEVLGFVYGLEDLDRLVVIKSIGLNSSEDEEGFTILQVSISAETYTTAELSAPIPEEGTGDTGAGDETTDTTSPDGTTDTTSPDGATDTTGGDE